MAFNTKINIDDQHVIQNTDTTLTLSGNTKYGEHPTFTGDTQIVDKKYVDDNIITGVTAGTTYDLGSPAAVSVGGIDVDYVLTGKTSNCIISDMLYPELEGDVTAPSMTSVVLTNSASCLEIGTSLTTNLTATFNQGCINPQYCSVCDKRSGDANSYCFTGTQLGGSVSCTANVAVTGITAYSIVAGANTWGACTSYDCGEPALSNKNNEYCAKLVAGTVVGGSDTITGILPWFWGTSADCTISSADVIAGTKTVGNVGSSTPIIFEATTEYLWFAAPACATDKTKWWVCAANAGNMGGTGELWAGKCTVSVTCGGMWGATDFDVYVTCGITSTPSGVSMCLYVG